MGANVNPSNSNELEQASLDRLRDMIRVALEAAAKKQGSFEALVHVMGYETGSQLSKIRNGGADLAIDKAAILDGLEIETGFCHSWSELVEADVADIEPRDHGRGRV